MVIRVIVRNELQLCVVGKELQHARAIIEKSLDEVFLVVIPGLVPHVGTHGVARVGLTILLVPWIAGNPHDAAREGGGAAEIWLLLDHEHVGTVLTCRDRGR